MYVPVEADPFVVQLQVGIEIAAVPRLDRSTQVLEVVVYIIVLKA